MKHPNGGEVVVRDANWRIERTIGRLMKTADEDSVTYEGIVATPHGYVKVESMRDDSDKNLDNSYTFMCFMWRGREYTRHLDRSFTKLGLTRAARKFVSEIVRG